MDRKAHLVIGVPVHDYEEARAVLKRLGVPADTVDKAAWLSKIIVQKELVFKGQRHEIRIRFDREQNADWPSSFPVGHNEKNTDAAVFFFLTSKYGGAVLDRGAEHSVPEPLPIDPLDLVGILDQVRAWWPEAQLLLWTRS